MPDTNDIDALLRYLRLGHTPHWYDDSTRWHSALTALVAERNELRTAVGRLWQILESAADRSPVDQTISEALTALVAERDALRERVAELEAASKRGDRDLRYASDAMVRWMDQVTAMLCHSMTHSHDAKQELVTRCDAAIVAMRREGEA